MIGHVVDAGGKQKYISRVTKPALKRKTPAKKVVNKPVSKLAPKVDQATVNQIKAQVKKRIKGRAKS